MMMFTALLFSLSLQASTALDSFPSDGQRVERPGIPGTLCVFGPQAQAVLTSGGSHPQAVAGLATVGEGRVFAIAHNGYLAPAFFEEQKGLMASALDWLRRGAKPGQAAFLGRAGSLAPALVSRGYELHALDWDAIGDLQLLVIEGEGPLSSEEQQTLARWLREGGSVLAAICPWGWQQIHAGEGWHLERDMAANQVLAPHGLLFTDGYADAAQAGHFVVDRAACAAVNCQSLIEKLAKGTTSASLAPLESALRVLPIEDELLLPRLMGLLPTLEGGSAPTPQTPLQSGPGSLLRLAVIAHDRRLSAATPDKPLLAPGAQSFPGSVALNAERLERRLSFDPQAKGWQSTGLYLAAGEVLHVSAKSGTLAGWSYRIGAHADSLWHKQSWPRWPTITRTGDLGDGESVRLTSPFGGLVYLQAESEAPAAKTLEVLMEGAVAAAWWRSGETSAKDWRELREAPAPWAELQGEFLILTLPSSAVRALADPEELMAWWDRVVLEQFALAGEEPPRRPERFVADVLISAGYMHSGYPVMMHLDVARPRASGQLAVLVDLEELESKGNWGCFHELGHNRQQASWTFSGTGEVTNNLFSLYSGELMSGIEPWANPWLEGQKQAGRDYLEAGADFEQWCKKPGVALLCYAQVQHAFGWQPFREVFQSARDLERSQQPKSDAAKRSFWVRSLSVACQRDLRPFHVHWGWPLEPALLADETLDALPEWMPDKAE